VRRKRPNSSNWKSDAGLSLEGADEAGVAREVLVRLERVEPGVEEHVLRDLARVVLARARRRDADGVEVRAVAALVAHLAAREHRLQRDRAARARARAAAGAAVARLMRHDVGDEAGDAQQVLGERTRVRRTVGAAGLAGVQPPDALRAGRGVKSDRSTPRLGRLALVTRSQP
jgi:hypothetical protein